MTFVRVFKTGPETCAAAGDLYAAAAMKLNRFLTGARTAWRIGLRNVLSVLLYRLRCRVGAVTIEPNEITPGEFFISVPAESVAAHPRGAAIHCFGWKRIENPLGEPPDWFLDPVTQWRYPWPARLWHDLPDFDEQFGDIKCIWELSRWDWTLAFAQRYRHSADDSFIAILNHWLRDWLEKNPAYRGPNWKSGQEAAIRVMHVAMAALILEQVRNPARALIDLVRLHLRRIEPTLSYAMAQDNNHGISEAAALFIGGSWLSDLGEPDGLGWERQGRHWLENRVLRLVGPDGSFSQHSVNYHRVLLDTLCMVEVWRRRMRLSGFSDLWGDRAEAAARWLYAMTDPETGDAPNVGANDGARLLPLSDTDFRDFRPSVQLGMAVFAGQAAYPGHGSWNLPMQRLGIEVPSAAAARPKSRQYEGGYALLRKGSVMALMRYPRFRFRPSHADALHLDLWKDGVNLLRDAGTYSYNTEPRWISYFSGTAGHNTIQFDDRDQMPRLGRFLFGDWLEVESIERLHDAGEVITFSASYRDGQGAYHHRRVTLNDDRLAVEDRIDGFSHKAVLRWRLMPAKWRIQNGEVTNGGESLSISASIPIVRLELVTGWESRYYMMKTELPVVEVEVHQGGVLTSEYRWSR